MAGPAALLIVAAVAFATLAVLSSRSPSSRGTGAPRDRPPAPSASAPSASTLFATASFRGGVQGWRALPGTFLTRGVLGEPTATFARVQRDSTTRPVRDPSTGSEKVGITTRVPISLPRGRQVRFTVRVRATKPGVTAVVRVSEEAGEPIAVSEGRVTLPDTNWRQLHVDHRVLGAGAWLDLEVGAFALVPDQALYVDRPVVTSS